MTDHLHSKTPVELIRDLNTRAAAARSYVQMFERFAELEQMHRFLGNWAEAEGAHIYGLLCLRAHLAEIDDPAVPHG